APARPRPGRPASSVARAPQQGGDVNAAGHRCADLLAALVARPTNNPGGDELALCEDLALRLVDLGADEVVVMEDERPSGRGGTVFARYGSPRLLLNAHLDTVPPNQGWTGDPFALTRDGDRLIGLGACDTKGAIAA